MDTITLPPSHEVRGELALYREVVPLTPERHGSRGILPGTTAFGFAADSPTVPLTVDEFERAALDYPIVFFGSRRQAVAVTGLTAKRNLFIDRAGGYAPGAYIPAHLRRHPFILAAVEGRDEKIVCIDEVSDRLVDADAPGAEPLFTGGATSKRANDAIGLARAMEAAERRTAAFTALLDEYDLFEPRVASFQAPDAGDAAPELLLNHVAVSRERLDALDGAALAALSNAGALAPIWAHLLSTANWSRLTTRLAAPASRKASRAARSPEAGPSG